ncbi:CHASE2 domain-containing protein [Chromobacterium violaceum]|uniref:CHASE2 domain-containing protein n=1 Tax=Chromobacterium violaceum TaxID=536 RepID=UPI001CE0D446|nr:CHASE2 domain-containing protein [Chromobacterium violaceum]
MRSIQISRYSRGIPLLLALLGLLLIASQLMGRLDFWLYDSLTRANPLHKPDQNLIVIAIDEKSLAELGRWPWPRAYHAQLLDKLGGASSIGFDIAIAEPSRDHPEADKHLAEAIRRNGKVVGPVFPELQGGQLLETRPLPPIASAMAALGHTDYERDDDGTIRRVYLKAGLGAPRYPSFAAAVCAISDGRKETIPAPQRPRPGQAWQRRDLVMVPFSSGPKPFHTVSYSDALNRLPASFFEDSIVLIGVTANGLGNQQPTPVSANNTGMSGVEIDAYMVHGLLTHQQIRPMPLLLECLLGALLLGLGDWLLSRRVRARSLLAGYALASAAVLLSSAALLYFASLWAGGSVVAILLLLSGTMRYVSGQAQLFSLAFTDGLTRLYNRRHFDEAFGHAVEQSRQKRKPLALLILDIDHFKKYNDHYGHYAGDEALQKVARALKDCFRQKGQLTARLGGEEFGVLLTPGDTPQALSAAERFLGRLAAMELPHSASPLGKISCSIGVCACIPGPADSTRTLFEQADQALYEAKRGGRNRASLYQGPPRNGAKKSADISSARQD